MGYLRKVKAGLVKQEIDLFVGEYGNIFFDIDSGSLRLSDGITPGGLSLSAGGTGSYILPTASVTVKGGIKIGDNVSISLDGTISVAAPFSGSYTDLTDTPVIPTIPSNISAFVNDSNYLTSVSWGDISGKPTLSTVATSGSYTDLINTPSLFSGSYVDLSNKPTFSTVSTTGSYTDLINIPDPEAEMAYARRTDFTTNDTIIYKGEAIPGSSESSAVWRIHRLTLNSESDVTEEWASGNSNYDKIWSNRLLFVYS